jgi:hypothetical protein
MSVREVLIAARGLIAKGWTQGFAARDVAGQSVEPWSSPSACSWCIVGALNVACGTDVSETYDGLARRKAAFESLEPFVGCEDWLFWNDTPGRTQAEVLAAFDRAIEAQS